MHIGFIMDGNRRWATARNLAKHLGHHQGAEAAERIVELCVREKIECASLWALAKKNILERSPEELTFLYALLQDWTDKIREQCLKNNVRFDTVGDLSLLPSGLQNALQTNKDATKANTGMTLILAIGYGGQDEIVRAVRRAIESGIAPEDVNETSFLQFLDSGSFPPPDLIVRTGGDSRHSGYFLYQAEYSEYYFTKTLWPDFREEEFYTALQSLQSAKRNFGK